MNFVRDLDFKFLSTPSARRATDVADFYCDTENISIHALREEGDKMRRVLLIILMNFYPRPPRGGRLLRAVKRYYNVRFLSTPSARRATFFGNESHIELRQISIHALREEGDISESTH